MNTIAFIIGAGTITWVIFSLISWESTSRRQRPGGTWSRSPVSQPGGSRQAPIIEDAIASGSDVVFSYKKPSDANYIDRRVTPAALVYIGHVRSAGRTLCVTGYCHLRGAERTFALRRMRNLRQLPG